MVRVLIFLGLMLLMMFFAPFMAGQKGYVLIAAGEYTIEMTVISLVITLLAGILALWVFEWVIKRVFSMSSSGRNWFSSRKTRRAHNEFKQGLLSLIEGDWQKAQKLLTQSAEHSDYRTVNYLYAGEAAIQQGDKEAASNLFKQASEAEEAAVVARIRYLDNQLKHQKNILDEVDTALVQHPQHTKLVQLKIDALRQQKRWIQLLEYLPEAKKSLPKKTFIDLQKSAYQQAFEQTASEQGLEAVNHLWQGLSRKFKSELLLNKAYIEALISLQQHQQAEQQLLPMLKKQLSVELLSLLKVLPLTQPQLVVSLIEKKLKDQPEDLILLRALADVSFKNGDKALAQKAIHRVCELGGENQDWTMLADLAEQSGDTQLALSSYKQLARAS